jgi:hypothetical protein
VPKLKVFRTAIGFHDAYVAAPSMKAALKAWGTTKDLFSRGAAELVTDPKLTEEPLAHPGEVLKLSRGSTAEQLAALPKDNPKDRSAKLRAMSTIAVPTKPRPDKSKLEDAETALSEAANRHRRQSDDLDAQIAELETKRRALATASQREIAMLEKTRAIQEERYRRAMDKWRAE